MRNAPAFGNTPWRPRRDGPFVWVDFNDLDDEGNVRLAAPGIRAELRVKDIMPSDGLELNLWDNDGTEKGDIDDLVVEGTVRWNPASGEWVAEVDWERCRHVSDDVGA